MSVQATSVETRSTEIEIIDGTSINDGNNPIVFAAPFDRHVYDLFLSTYFPDLRDLVWLDRPGVDDVFAEIEAIGSEFDTDAGEGRGDSYRRAQRSGSARQTGISTLFRLIFGTDDPGSIPEGFRLLDVLGGDGLLARNLRDMAPHISKNPIITGDISGHMVLHALSHGLPALRSPAQFLLLRDACIDAVLLAYGTHHIPPRDRDAMYQESVRVVRSGGQVVVHDFEQGSPVDRWFEEIVHEHSLAGHDLEHFTRQELEDGLKAAGCSDVSVHYMYDPICLGGRTEKDAVEALLDYLISMYGLKKIDDRGASGRTELLNWLKANMCYNENTLCLFGVHPKAQLTVYKSAEQGYVAELPRLALIGRGYVQ